MPVISKNIFLYCVCGKKQFLEELNLSIQFLKYFSKHEIIVLTDNTRNEIAIEHDNIIDVATPKKFNHHQASIYLKTGCYQFLDMAHLYCYLDSDIFAIQDKIDEVFSLFNPPISFAADLVNIEKFSNYAVHLPTVKERYPNIRVKLHQLIASKEFEQTQLIFKETSILYGAFVRHKTKNNSSSLKFYLESFIKSLSNSSKTTLLLLPLFFCFLLVKLSIKLVDNILYLLPVKFISFLTWTKNSLSTQLKRNWYQASGFYDYIKANKGEAWFKENLSLLDLSLNPWILPEGKLNANNKIPKAILTKKKNLVKLYNNSEGLALLIKEKFDVAITDMQWQHWNGGLFVFNKNSIEFLKTWHNYTMEIFKDSQWKTRDQGTLIATAWKYQLQKHPTIPLDYNFFLLKENFSTYQENFLFNTAANQSKCKPIALHILDPEFPNDSQLKKDFDELTKKIVTITSSKKKNI